MSLASEAEFWKNVDEGRIKQIQRQAELIEALKKIAAKYEPDYEAGEYWDSGNFDDAFESGVSQGEQYVYEDIHKLLKKYEQE